MNTKKSYVISVSAGTGCYRHIQIAADATLFELHCAILNAFEFDDDHEHAFFMDNRLWSTVECYRSTGKNSTRKRRLSELSFTAGTAFKYVFDFGDEWVFRCKLLRELDEPCDHPHVIRSKGEAPQQYQQGSEFDEEELNFPELFSQAELKKCYRALNMPEETVAMLHQYFAAMAELYGIIPLRKALEIINSQNVPISETEFLAFAEIVRHEEHYYAILGEDELYEDGKKSLPVERKIVHESLYAIGLSEYDDMLDMQQGKPYYIPPKDTLLKYADECYCEPSAQSDAMERYLNHEKKLHGETAKEVLLEIQMIASMGELDMQYLMDDMERIGVKFENIEDVQQFFNLFMDLSNNSRMQSNRGHTPKEIRAMYSPEERTPKSITFGPNMTKALCDGTMDAAEYRKAIAQMKLPNEGLRRSMLSQLDGIAPEPQAKIKVGRNDPCPCGSGKKYKKCCGRNE